MVSAHEGKTELFPKKVPKKSPKTGSGWINPTGTISQFFHEFPGSLKFQDEMPGAGKRGGAGGYAPRENHKNFGLTDRHTLALGIPGSLKKRRLRRNNFKLSEIDMVDVLKGPPQARENFGVPKPSLC